MDEFEIIKRYIKPVRSDRVLLGRGDDCSVVDLGDGQYLIETTDCLVEDIHFRLRDFTFAELAYKSLAVNLSDIAAMGGTPLRAHLNLAVPETISEEQVKEFFAAYYQVAEPLGVALIGGDLSASPHSVFVNLHISGEVAATNIKWRSGLGEPGVLCVTGPLGDSAAGFYCLENNLEIQQLIRAHKRPPFEIEKGKWLSQQSAVQGMMDLSDGLLSDLQRIEKGRITIDVEKIPMTLELLKLAEKIETDPLRWSVSGGEDYRLLVNCRGSEWGPLSEAYELAFAEKLIPIGRVEGEGEAHVEFHRKGEPIAMEWPSFKHF